MCEYGSSTQPWIYDSYLDEAVVSETGCGLPVGTAAHPEVVAVGRLCSQISATHLSTLSCSVAGGAIENGVAAGNADALAHCASTAHTCGRGVLTFSLDLAVASKEGCVLGGAALHGVIAVERQLIQVAAMHFSTTPRSIAEGVTEGGTAHCSTDILTHCSSTTPPCGMVCRLLAWMQQWHCRQDVH